MTFVQIETRNSMINLDGYSRNKTLKGALKDLAREVAKIDEGEARAITDYIDETVQMVADGMANEAGAYYIGAEEVPCASRYKFLNGDEDDFSDENVEIQYAEGHWYLYIRFCAPEQESEEQEDEQTAPVLGTSEATPAATDSASSLTEEEIKFFNDTVARIKYSVNVHVPIEIMNHDNLVGKHKEALGICWAEGDETGKPAPFRITIDEYFVHECFVALERPYMKLEPQSLEQVIAHEIAHLHIWQHGKKHTELTERIFRLIEEGKPHGLNSNIADHTHKTGRVNMAAMQPIRGEPRSVCYTVFSNHVISLVHFPQIFLEKPS